MIDKDLSNNQEIKKIKTRLNSLIQFYKQQKVFYDDVDHPGLVNKWKKKKMRNKIMLIKVIIKELSLKTETKKEINRLLDRLWEEIDNKPIKPFPKE